MLSTRSSPSAPAHILPLHFQLVDGDDILRFICAPTICFTSSAQPLRQPDAVA